MSSGLPVYTSNETMNPLLCRRARSTRRFWVRRRLAKVFDPTRDGIRLAIGEAIANRDELNRLRPEVAAFAREHFGTAQCPAAHRHLALVRAPGRASGLRPVSREGHMSS